MNDDTLFPAGETTPGQAESRRAYKAIAEQLKEHTWWQDYLWLREQGWDWRKAVYIAWAASPVKERTPVTQEELATQILGLGSDRVIATWRKREAIDDTVAVMQAAPLLRHRRDIYEALVKVAVDPDPKAHADRKLALELLGDYKPKSQVETTGKDGGPLEGETTIRIVYEDDRASATQAASGTGEGGAGGQAV